MKTKKQLEKEIEEVKHKAIRCNDCMDGSNYCRTHLVMLDRDRATLTQTNEIIEFIENKRKRKGHVDDNSNLIKELLTKIKGDGE